MKDFMMTLFGNFGTEIVFLHIISAVVWVGGMILRLFVGVVCMKLLFLVILSVCMLGVVSRIASFFVGCCMKCLGSFLVLIVLVFRRSCVLLRGIVFVCLRFLVGSIFKFL